MVPGANGANVEAGTLLKGDEGHVGSMHGGLAVQAARSP